MVPSYFVIFVKIMLNRTEEGQMREPSVASIAGGKTRKNRRQTKLSPARDVDGIYLQSACGDVARGATRAGLAAFRNCKFPNTCEENEAGTWHTWRCQQMERSQNAIN